MIFKVTFILALAMTVLTMTDCRVAGLKTLKAMKFKKILKFFLYSMLAWGFLFFSVGIMIVGFLRVFIKF